MSGNETESPRRECNEPDCTFPDTGKRENCLLAQDHEDPYETCPNLVRLRTSRDLVRPTSTPSVEAIETASWTGDHINETAITRLLGRSHPRVVAVIGEKDAGKTSLLTSFFLQLANGQRKNFRFRFASSLTLRAFDRLATEVSRTQRADEAMFLHLGLRPEQLSDNRHIDALFSDVAGEVLLEHAGQRTDTSTSTVAFMRRADAIIVVVDAGLLLTADGGRHDRTTGRILSRVISDLSNEKNKPPFAVVFAKIDRAAGLIPTTIDLSKAHEWEGFASRTKSLRHQLDQATRQNHAVQLFSASAFPRGSQRSQPFGIMEPFAFAMDCADLRSTLKIPLSVPTESAGYFNAMRCRSVST